MSGIDTIAVSILAAAAELSLALVEFFVTAGSLKEYAGGGVSDFVCSSFESFLVDAADTLESFVGVNGVCTGDDNVTVGVDGPLLGSTLLPGLDTFGVGALTGAADLLLALVVFFVTVDSLFTGAVELTIFDLLELFPFDFVSSVFPFAVAPLAAVCDMVAFPLLLLGVDSTVFRWSETSDVTGFACDGTPFLAPVSLVLVFFEDEDGFGVASTVLFSSVFFSTLLDFASKTCFLALNFGLDSVFAAADIFVSSSDICFRSVVFFPPELVDGCAIVTFSFDAVIRMLFKYSTKSM